MGEGITLLPLSSAELVVALPRQHRLAAESRIALRDLMQEEWVMFSRHLSPVYFDSITAACRSEGFSPRIIHHVRSVSSQIAFVGCGQGIALVPDSLERLSPANVVTVPLDQTIEVITTAVAWSASRKNPLADKFIALIQTPEVA